MKDTFDSSGEKFAITHHLKDATEKVVSLVSQGVKYVQKCSLIIKYC